MFENSLRFEAFYCYFIIGWNIIKGCWSFVVICSSLNLCLQFASFSFVGWMCSRFGNSTFCNVHYALCTMPTKGQKKRLLKMLVGLMDHLHAKMWPHILLILCTLSCLFLKGVTCKKKIVMVDVDHSWQWRKKKIGP